MIREELQKEVLHALLSNLNSKELLKNLLSHLQQEQNLQLNEVIDIYNNSKNELTIPLSIFSHQLHSAEALTKYLKENEHLSNKEIAQLLNRNEKSVWSTYQRAKKAKINFIKKSEKYILPLSIFQDRSFSLMEHIVFYLHKVYGLTNPKIACILHKSPNSMAVLLKRAKQKKLS